MLYKLSNRILGCLFYAFCFCHKRASWRPPGLETNGWFWRSTISLRRYFTGPFPRWLALLCCAYQNFSSSSSEYKLIVSCCSCCCVFHIWDFCISFVLINYLTWCLVCYANSTKVAQVMENIILTINVFPYMHKLSVGFELCGCNIWDILSSSYCSSFNLF